MLKTRKSMPTPERRRDAKKTREDILRAAQKTFASDGYDQTGVRNIADIAGIDAALICRYFGGKQELLRAVLESQSRLTDVLDGPADSIGGRLADRLLIDKAVPADEDVITQMLVVLRAASSPQAAPLLAQSIEDNFMAPLRARLKGPNKEERAMLIASCVFGTAVLRFVLGVIPADKDKQVAKGLGRIIQEAAAD